MSYAAKYIETAEEYKKTSVICPAIVEPELAREIISTALRAFRAVGGWGYGRVDIRLEATAGRACWKSTATPVSTTARAGPPGRPRRHLLSPPLQMIVKAALEGMPYDADIPMM